MIQISHMFIKSCMAK